MSNKKSIWSVIILIVTIISLILLAISLTFTSLAIPSAYDAARQGAIDGGATAANADVIATAVLAGLIAALALDAAFDVLKIVGGFLFSLKGRWGVFCIVVSIIALVLGVWNLINNIVNKTGAATIVPNAIGVAADLLLCVSCFMHRAELKKA